MLAGRARELDELRGERLRSAGGELRVVLVLGDAGMGKTRLATELLPHDGEPAVGLIARSCALRPLPSLGRWTQTLGRRGSGGPPPPSRGAGIGQGALSGAGSRRHGYAERAVSLLTAASPQHRSVVVVLDDLHWADEALWETLLLLAWDHQDAPLLVLGTARPAELVGHRAAAEAALVLEQQAVLRQVRLLPLSRQDIGELAAAALQRDAAPPALVGWLTAHSRGSPRFAVGLLEALVEQGADLHAPRLCAVPEGLARWICAEVTRLDPSDRAILELLALVGGLIDPDDLAQIFGRPLEDVAAVLERLVRRGLVVERDHDQPLGYEVAHPLVQQVLYAGIGGARQRVWHRRAARTLLASRGAQAAAWHFSRSARAGDDEAFSELVKAVWQADQQGCHAQAWAIVETLLDLLPSGDQRWLEVSDALSWQPDWDVARLVEDRAVAGIVALRQMERQIAATGDLSRLAGVRLRLAGFLVLGAGDLEAGTRACQEAVALYLRAGREHEARMAAVELAGVRLWAGDLCGQELAARRLVSEAEQAGDRQAVARALGVLGTALGAQGRFGEAEDALARGIELASPTAQFLRFHSLECLAVLDACRGRMASAWSRWARAASGSPVQGSAGESGAYIALLAGDLAAVQAHTGQSAAHSPAMRLPVRAWVGAVAAMAAAEGGRVAEARRDLDRAQSVCHSPGRDLFALFCHWAEGVVTWAEDRLADAAGVLQRAVDRCVAISAYSLAGFVLADLVEVAAVDGDADTAARAWAAAEDVARRTAAPSCQALERFAAAWAWWSCGRDDEAAQAASHAVDGLGSSGLLLLEARARIVYAHAVRQRDRQAAADALAQAAAGFEACGAVRRHERARRLLAQLHACERQGVAVMGGLDSLTGRERQVAELAARGCTARQIAELLYIGKRTVESHLARVYPKLGITCKQQLIRHAARLGLLRSHE
ncbi:MAG: ATP-binding protein [Egibacteraceae bacterium]